jgi:ADP-heptose:LPS heptosyltransferase
VSDTRRFEPTAFRKRRNRLLGIGSELVGPLLRFGGSVIARRPPSDPANWKSGLIIGHNHIGDVLYRTCSMPALRLGLPQCQWSYLTSPAGAEILERNPDVDQILPLNVGDDSWQLSDNAFAKLREHDFDAILCSNTIRYHPDLFLATALGIPNRVAFTHKGLSGLSTRSITPTYPSAFPAYFRAMVATITGTDPSWPLEPRIFPDDSDQRVAASVMSESGIGDGSPIVACTITTRQPRGNWPAGSLLELLREVADKTSFHIALCGAAGDEPVLESAKRQLDGLATVLAGKFTVRQFAAFLARCSALVTIDSGPRHIGNAAGIPVYFFRNLLHSQVEAGAYCETETDLAPHGEFLSDEEIERMAAAFPVKQTAETLANRIKASTGRL